MQLTGKTVLFLGSSVTYGYASGGVSFVDFMADICGIDAIKEAVSGTTLADINEKSYVSRLKNIDKNTKIDLFICQLSTNDATKNVEFSEVEKAIRFILEYAKKTFGCPCAFYTGTYFENEAYLRMIDLLYSLQKEYDFYILDLYNDDEMRSVDKEKYKSYMHDHIHPSLNGYKEWWTPKFIEFCNKIP